MRGIHYIALSAVLFISCNSENAWDCLQKEGQSILHEIELDTTIAFLKVFDDINVEFHNGDSQRLVLETGENLLSDIEFVPDTGAVHVFNYNACKWTRNPDNITLHIFGPGISILDMHGYGSMTSADSISYRINFRTYGSGSADLLLSSNTISFQLYSLFNVKLRGSAERLSLYVNTGRDARVDASELKVNTCGIFHDGANDVIVGPQSALSYRIWNAGNIILTQKPSEVIEVERTGTGKLIENF